MYNLFYSCFCCYKITHKLSVNEHMLCYIRENNFIISNKNTYTITLIMNECIRYINLIHDTEASSMKYTTAMRCMHNILYKELSVADEMNKMMNFI